MDRRERLIDIVVGIAMAEFGLGWWALTTFGAGSGDWLIIPYAVLGVALMFTAFTLRAVQDARTEETGDQERAESCQHHKQ